MNNRSIDREVAEIVGADLGGFDWMYPENHHGNIEDNKLINWETAQFFWVPRYSTDWNAMRLLVEWLQSKSFMIITNQYPNDYGYTFCYIQKWNDDHGWETLAIKKEDTAPLALCHAVLSLPIEVLKSDV
jgi:hypothetical protein